MHFLTKRISANVFEFAELKRLFRALIEKAANARLNAQAPYSGFAVGAAVLSTSGLIYTGCNVERVSYTQTTHAEQNAVDYMVLAEGSAKLSVVAVIGAPVGEEVVLDGPLVGPPIRSFDKIEAPCCAHCLQIIWENCCGDPAIELIGRQSNGQYAIVPIGSALPLRFGPDALGVDYGTKTRRLVL